MSAIWGYIQKKETNKELADIMSESMKDFQIDRVSDVHNKNVFFACGHQHFTPESVSDVSPIHDEALGVVFDADCFLFNRTELIAELEKTKIISEKVDKMGDAQLCFWAYKCWKDDFVCHLSGSFSFVIYDENTCEIKLYSDYTSSRYLTYYQDDDVILFSTIFQPVLAALSKDKIKLCEKWIAAAYMDLSADTIKLPRITVYENVFQVEPASIVTLNISNNSKKISYYWNPIKSVKCLKNVSDEEIRRRYITTFEKIIEGMTRPLNNVGIKLSGGLDSSTVAAFLARELSKKDMPLYSYTGIPSPDYEYVNDLLTVENETEYVLAQKSMYENIQPKFLDGYNRNSMVDIIRYNGIFREPVKPVLNMPYIDSFEQEAVKDKCSLLFSGGNGNATISYGRILTYVYQKIVVFKWKEANREINAFCMRFRLSRKKFLKVFLKTLWDEKFHNVEWGESCFIKPELRKKYKLDSLMKKISRTRGTGSVDSVKQRKNFCFMPEVFQHMGFYDTYSSLYYGVMNLDPTISREIIELGMSTPIDAYVKNGKERRAVRDYMKGYVCDTVLDNYTARGSQAADYSFRFNRDWNEIKGQVLELINKIGLENYFEKKYLDKLINECNNNEGLFSADTVACLSVICSLSAFLEIYKK